MEEKEYLTKEELEDIIQFSQGLMYAGNYYTPFTSNQLLQNLTTVKNLPKYEDIKQALVDYKSTPEGLATYTDFATTFDMLFKRTLYSYANSLSYDMHYVCTNAYSKADYDSKEYLADKRKVDEFLLGFDYKKEFYNVALSVMKHEQYFTWFRKISQTGGRKPKYALQIMPQDRCKMTGVFDKGYLWSMDMAYFMQGGVDIDTFDPSLKETYLRTVKKHKDDYHPSAELDKRTGSYSLWADVSPNDGAWCWKHNQSDYSPIPFLAPFVKQVIRSDELEELQHNKDLTSAYAILAGEIQLYDGAKSGEQKNQFAIDLKLLGQLLSKAKEGVGSLVKVAAMPTKNNTFYQYKDENPDTYKDSVVNTAASGTAISRVIYSTDRMSATEFEGAQNEVYRTMADSLYPQFANFLDFYVNQITKKYKFKFTFDGASYRWEQNNRFEHMMKLADKGIVMNPSYFASVLGMNPAVFEASLRDSKQSGWLEEYSQMMMNVNTMSMNVNGEKETVDVDEAEEAGRPRIEDAVNDSTEASREMVTE